VAPKKAHTRANPQQPLIDPVSDPERIIKEGKALQKGASSSGISKNPSVSFPENPLIKPTIVEAISSEIDSEKIVSEVQGLSDLTQEDSSPFVVEDIFSSFVESSQSETKPNSSFIHTNLPAVELVLHELSVKGEENLAQLLSEFYRASYFPFSTASPKIPSPLITSPSSSKSASSQSLVNQTPSASTSTVIMAATPQNLTKMERIVAARYAPLVLPNPLNAMPTGDYQKYMPKFSGVEEVTAEEHLELFYSYVDNLNITDEDVWMRVFVQSLDGEARRWFRELTPGSITGIEVFDDIFLKQWGDKKDFLYYITEFGNLRRESGQSVSDFTKKFNRMYSKIPAEIKPTATSAKITYSNAFDAEFCLLLRERRSVTLADMQDATLEVESNILAAEKLKGRGERRKQKGEASSSSVDPNIEKMEKMIESLTSELSKMKLENKHPTRGREPNTFIPRNPNPYRRNNEQHHILQRNRNANEDQNIKTPFQNTVMEEEQPEEDDEIHCLGDKGDASFLTQVAYEEALLSQPTSQDPNEESICLTDEQNRYNLRSKQNNSKQDEQAPTKKVVAPAKQQPSKDQAPTKNQVLLKAPVQEVKNPDKAPFSFSFE
jgi:hypothetical protein